MSVCVHTHMHMPTLSGEDRKGEEERGEKKR